MKKDTKEYTYLVVTIVLIVIFFWFLNKLLIWDNGFIYKIIISISTQVSNIIVLLAFFATFYLFNKEQKNISLRKKKARKARAITLKKEIEVNLLISKSILKLDDSTITLPENKFIYSITESFLKSGDIIEDRLTDMWSLYLYMKTANSLLKDAVQILYYEHITDPLNTLSNSGREKRILDLKKHIMRCTKETKILLEELRLEY